MLLFKCKATWFVNLKRSVTYP